MTFAGALFDSSGTLLRIEPAERWLRAVLDGRGIEATGGECAHYAALLEAAGALPGGSFPERVPPHLAELWQTRDRDPERHRAAYTGLARQVALPWPDEVYDALYERHMTPAAWLPYPDAGTVLSGLRRRGVRAGLLSNVGWDWRPVYREHGLDRYLDTYVQSYEHGVQKPDPALFTLACARLGLAPEDVLMVGDSESADGGARAIGCGFHLVRHLPVEERPDGLLPVLELVG